METIQWNLQILQCFFFSCSLSCSIKFSITSSSKKLQNTVQSVCGKRMWYLRSCLRWLNTRLSSLSGYWWGSVVGGLEFCPPDDMETQQYWQNSVSWLVLGLNTRGRSQWKSFFREREEKFQRQKIEFARNDALMNAEIELVIDLVRTKLVLTSKYETEALFEKRMLMLCLIETLQAHNSDYHKQKMWLKNLKINLDKTEKMFPSWGQRHLWVHWVYSQKWIFQQFFWTSEMVGLSQVENVASNELGCLKDFNFLVTDSARGGSGTGNGGGSTSDWFGIWIMLRSDSRTDCRSYRYHW